MNKKFTKRLREVLSKKSIRGLAKECDVSEGSLRRYLKGESDPSLQNVIAIARAANVSVAWLVGESDDPGGDGISFLDFLDQKLEASRGRDATQEVGPKDSDGTQPAEDVNIIEALDWARAILESDTPYRVALYHNLRAFYQAVDKEEKMRRMEQLMGEMLNEIRQMRLEIAELKSSAGTEKRETKVA